MSEPRPPEPRLMFVPASSRDDDPPEALVRSEDIASTSRSCLAIILILLFIAVMICAFLLLQPFVR